LFPFGFGLSLKDRCSLGVLHENGLRTSPDRLRIFEQGSLIGDWTLASDPDGAISMQAADYGRQENALALDWGAPASAVFSHAPMDMTREGNGDIHLRMFFAASADFAAHLRVSLVSGAGMTPVKGDVRALSQEGEDWVLDISLKRAPGLGIDLTSFAGLSIEADQPGRLILTRLVFEMITT
jgi:hypothetical protein